MNMLNKFKGGSKRGNLFNVFNEDSSGTAVVELFGPVYENPPKDSEGDYIALSEVRKELNKIKADKITVKINTTGGSFWAGTSIANLLREHSADIKTVVIGVAASAGSIIFLAGEKREMYKNSSLLIHNVRTAVYGDWKTLKEMSDELKELDNSLIENYKNIFNGTEKELRKILDDDKFMSAQTAKDKGFCTSIIDSEAENDQEIENKINDFFGNFQGSRTKRNNFRQSILSDRPRKNEKLINELMEKYKGKNNKNLFQKQ